MKISNPLDKKTEIGPLIRPSEVDRVQGWVKESIENGSETIFGGKKLSETTYEQTLLLNPKKSDKVSTQEIFGPVACMFTYRNLEEAINEANCVNTSFQASIFSEKFMKF